ncbi:hypothetical protein FJU08_00730 [Martelella alba]|uniref:Uncharacterized protein n=1 Tax=Martelella alba TaxID=2590451 RepID=A0A506UIJ3_9HYPH|nr:hypothetical protein [Martelella alba]TPW33126.1 hypothetical protein FJU08_00730 [Martelella alba]
MSDIEPNLRETIRNSPAGKTLTESQFDEALMITGIIDREIHKSGAFREKLTAYAGSFAQGQPFDALKGEAMIRDIYKARYGETMNAVREKLVEREAQVHDALRQDALPAARSILTRIREGETMPFYRAHDDAAIALAAKWSVTEQSAKVAMHETFRENEGRELYEAGKEAEKTYHQSARDAGRAERSAVPAEKRRLTRQR